MKRVARRPAPSHTGKVRKNLTDEVLKALKVAKRETSTRKLAKEAGVTHALLSQLEAHDFQVTPTVAEKLARVFDRWGARFRELAPQYRELARTIRAAARRVPLRTGRTR